MKLYLS